jgi:biotin synthase
MDKNEIRSLLDLPLTELIAQANKVRQTEMGTQLDLCTIINAKSGMCSEDCKFCCQSGHHATGVETYPLKEKQEIFQAAQTAKDNGAKRFGIVTSGNSLTKDEIHRIADAIYQIKSKIAIDACASLGCLDLDDFALLKKAGLTRYHHNIETSPRHFAKIVTSHTFQERIETIKAAKSLGLQLCSGGIIGLGEDWDDRIEMAQILKKLDVDSVPLNILVPIKGTPLENQPPVSCNDVIKTIAIFRIILRNKIIKVAAGRETALKDFQGLAFLAGANGMLIGGYLTVKGRDLSQDKQLIQEIKETWKA